MLKLNVHLCVPAEHQRTVSRVGIGCLVEQRSLDRRARSFYDMQEDNLSLVVNHASIGIRVMKSNRVILQRDKRFLPFQMHKLEKAGNGLFPDAFQSTKVALRAPPDAQLVLGGTALIT